MAYLWHPHHLSWAWQSVQIAFLCMCWYELLYIKIDIGMHRAGMSLGNCANIWLNNTRDDRRTAAKAVCDWELMDRDYFENIQHTTLIQFPDHLRLQKRSWQVISKYGPSGSTMCLVYAVCKKLFSRCMHVSEQSFSVIDVAEKHSMTASSILRKPMYTSSLSGEWLAYKLRGTGVWSHSRLLPSWASRRLPARQSHRRSVRFGGRPSASQAAWVETAPENIDDASRSK